MQAACSVLSLCHHGAELLHAWRVKHPVYEPVLQSALGIEVLVPVEVVLYLNTTTQSQRRP